ncbi:unnamed protein product, partial [Allacma fusca]
MYKDILNNANIEMNDPKKIPIPPSVSPYNFGGSNVTVFSKKGDPSAGRVQPSEDILSGF